MNQQDHECMFRYEINSMYQDIKTIKQDMRILLSFKNRIIGGIIAVSAIFTLGVNIIGRVFWR
jgi:hypothetical protein